LGHLAVGGGLVTELVSLGEQGLRGNQDPGQVSVVVSGLSRVFGRQLIGALDLAVL
jgi:hypothetical protein